MYALIETGGKQYKVQEGDTLYVELLYTEPGQTVEIDKVLAVEKDGRLKVGTPLVEGAKVLLKVVRHGKGRKIIIFKYKAKKNYRRKTGHRQPFTQVTVEKIQA
ncbi:MAG: 50S ribosomal protein L21 [Bacillota bacterium]